MFSIHSTAGSVLLQHNKWKTDSVQRQMADRKILCQRWKNCACENIGSRQSHFLQAFIHLPFCVVGMFDWNLEMHPPHPLPFRTSN